MCHSAPNAGGLLRRCALLLGALILFWFPLRGQRLAAMQKDLLELHARKRLEYERMEATR